MTMAIYPAVTSSPMVIDYLSGSEKIDTIINSGNFPIEGIKDLDLHNLAKGINFYVGGVGPNNYTKIQDAIDNASNGDSVFVYIGTYYENVVVDKSISLIGENLDNTIIDGGSIGDVVFISADFVNVSEFTIINGNYYGIYVNYSDNVSIFNNNVSSNIDGICFDHSFYGIVEFNTASNNIWKGIRLLSSLYTNLNNNSIYYNIDGGLYVDSSNGCNIQYNTIFNNNLSGIYIKSSLNCIVFFNDLSNNDYSIYLDHYCKFCNVSNNTVLNNDFRGIFIRYSSNITVIYNDVLNNKEGVSIYYSPDNNITFNNVSYNENGIRIKNSFLNKIKYNLILENEDGIYIYDSSFNNSIIGNNISMNTDHCIFFDKILYTSNDNQIYHNNFHQFTSNQYPYDDCYNIWYNNSDFAFGGNYWILIC